MPSREDPDPVAEYARPFPIPRRAPLVGLIGFARSGKDTVAARLVAEHDFTKYAFADALRVSALRLNPIIEAWEGTGGATVYARLAEIIEREGWERAKDAYPEVRRVLQHYGTGIRDFVDSESWVNVVMRNLDRRPDSAAVITDVRFPNEYDAIRRRNGVLVRVIRPGTGGDSHISEQALAHVPVDYTLDNLGTIDALSSQIDRMAHCV